MKLALLTTLCLVAEPFAHARLLGKRDGNFFKNLFRKGHKHGGGNGDGECTGDCEEDGQGYGPGNGDGECTGDCAGGQGYGPGNGYGNRGKGGGPGNGGGHGNGGGMSMCDPDDFTIGALDTAEAAEVVFMREEEKMARDVYKTLFTEHKRRVFSNIAQSEQQHMNSMRDMIALYGLTDPITSESDIGTFVDPDLQQAFTDLTTKGKLSLIDAFEVGAYIEELDIVDLRDAIAATDEGMLQCAYGNLLTASYNHLRAFVRNIERNNGEFVPQVLDPLDVEDIFDGANW